MSFTTVIPAAAEAVARPMRCTAKRARAAVAEEGQHQRRPGPGGFMVAGAALSVRWEASRVRAR